MHHGDGGGRFRVGPGRCSAAKDPAHMGRRTRHEHIHGRSHPRRARNNADLKGAMKIVLMTRGTYPFGLLIRLSSMPTQHPEADTSLAEAVKTSWHRFLDEFEVHRPELYRYCRHLTRDPWDAEDLAQDALTRAFVTLGTLFQEPPNPRGWIFRVASNLWIDRMRRARHERELTRSLQHEEIDADPRAPREAAGTLLVRLSPQERAAVVLKDVFDFSIEEIADMLSTSR